MTGSVQSSSSKSFYQQINNYMPSKEHLKITGLVLTAAFTAFKLVNYYFTPTRIPTPTPTPEKPVIEVDCQIGELVDGVVRDYKFFKNEVESGNKFYAYCLGKIHESGVGNLKSYLLARDYYKMAYEENVKGSRSDLCQPKLLTDVTNNPDLKDKLKDPCCPDRPPKVKCLPCICPWNPAYVNSTFFSGSYCMHPTKIIYPYIAG